MKTKILITLLLFSQIVFAQNKNYTINDIKHITQVPYIENCSDPIFWQLVMLGKKNIPKLIQKLTDKTILKDVYVPNFGGEYAVADVSLAILQEKIKGIPVFELIGLEMDKDCGYCSYWYFVRKSKSNRLKLQKSIRNWYKNNKNKLIWVTSSHSLTGDCSAPSKGHYEILKNGLFENKITSDIHQKIMYKNGEKQSHKTYFEEKKDTLVISGIFKNEKPYKGQFLSLGKDNFLKVISSYKTEEDLEFSQY